ncbi:SusC/RagA family TonB-linked outer membrane protein [Robertkochia marina]|uniref:SusC/RagA family TonB-linked outer membrane protein n=1 Tax=Robertkochia marina TaxID=1227945 RepID=A0A4S3M6P7_9FLAO|nr:SusC/RagA family TonB-linked outer membrane protein [Robertkochia marina]THD69917.1 SusC/RagA family TonB-linked outer membrane protein [Robertkochia marina]TRZ46735.1 SusC/RagA family TonB-linked outer membrane protein [Robertkochia marina]
MKTKLNGFLALLLVLVAQISFAQTKTITGTVTDQDALPLPGASVLVKGTSNGTQTDFDGNYSIQASEGQVLVFSYVGQETQEITVGASSTINVQLLQSAQELGEVVLTALGLEKKKDEDLSSSTLVDTEALQKSGETGVIQGLAGKTSGIQITRNSGDPGAGAYIQIRGQNTITGSASPLIVLDGVAISNTSVGSGVGGVVQQSRLNDINPEDIESVTVLKGAAAAAVWGTGAANGVLVIKTKRGRGAGGSRMSVNVRSSVAFDEINVEWDKQDKFGQGLSGAWAEDFALSWGDKIADRPGGADVFDTSGEYFEADSGNLIYPITEKRSREVFNDVNRDQVFQTGVTLDNSVSIGFSGDNSNTLLSLSNLDQEGIIRGQSSYNRKTFRLNHEVNLTEKLTARINTNYSTIKSQRIQQGSNINGLYLGYLRTAPDFNNTDYKGTYYDANGVAFPNAHRAYRGSVGTIPVYNNPGWTINEQTNPNRVERFIINPEIQWQITDNMIFTGRYGLDYYTDVRETYFPANSSGIPDGNYARTEIAEKNSTWNFFLSSNYDLGEAFNLSWILGTQFEESDYHSIGGTSNNFTNPFLGDLRLFGNADAANELPFLFKQKTRKNGAYAVINAELFNQLFVELTGRYERPSTVEDNVFYPSASLGWAFSNIIPENNFLSFGKLRASYGEIGIEPQPYATRTTFGPGGVGSSWGDFLAAGTYGNPFTRSTTLGNPDLTIERIKEFEVGADFRFFNNYMTLGFTYYDRVTEDAILPLDLAPSSGFSNVLANAAEISNKGIEIDANVNIFNQGDFKWSVNANFSRNRNIVESLSGVQSVFLNGFTGASSRVVEGEPFGALWGGRLLRDAEGNLDLDANGFPQLDPEAGLIGDPNPDWRGGLGTTISWKGLTLSALFETFQGNEMWAGTKGVLNYFGISPETANETTAPTDLVNASGTVIPAGTTFRGNIGDFGAGPVALDQSWYLGLASGFASSHELYIEDASWTRLRELSLFYSLPTNMMESIGFRSAEIGVTGRNLVLWTDFEGVDPDLNLTGASKGRGLDYFTNPGTRSYLFTLRLGL